MSNNVGLTVGEGVSNGLTPFQLPSKRNMGLLMERERGVENTPILVSSLQEDSLRFGGFNSNMYGPVVVRNLIKNAKGYSTTIYGVRVIGSGSSAATGIITLPDGVTINITAAQNGIADKGAWGNNLVVKFYALGFKKLGKWYLEVYYKGDLVEAFDNALCSSLEADVNSNSGYVRVEFSSEPSSSIQTVGTGTITTVSAAVAEVLPTASFNITGAGSTSDTIEVSVGGTVLGSYTVASGNTTSDIATGLRSVINSGTHGFTAGGSASSIILTAPIGSGAVYNTATTTNAITGTVTATTGTFSGGVTAVPSGPSTTVTGSGTSFTTQLAVGSLLYTNTNILIGVVASIASNTSLTLQEISKVAITAQSFKFTLYGVKSQALSGGVYVSPVEADFYPNNSTTNPRGLTCFDGFDIQILASTEYHTLTMASQGRDYASARKDCIYIANLPFQASDATLLDYATNLQSNTTSFIAGYNGWVKTSDGLGSTVWAPSIGCVIGAAFIRVPAIQGDGIHIPPAGIDSAFVDILDVTPNRISQERLNIFTEQYTVNSITYQERLGYFVMTSRTYSTNPLYHSIHIRMQTSYYVRVLKNNLGWAIQRPNTPELKKSLITSCHIFFKEEYENGALERSVKFEEACVIICDQSNNPVSQDRKNLNLDIDWIPTETTEKLRVSLNRNDGFLLVKEATN